MIVDVPQQVRQEEQERDGAADPQPFRAQKPALLRQEQTYYDAETEDRHGVLVFEAHSRQHPEPDCTAMAKERRI